MVAKKLSTEAERLLWNLLEECPTWLTCVELSHHKRGDKHEYDEPCKPLARYEKAVNEAAEYFLRLRQNGKQ